VNPLLFNPHGPDVVYVENFVNTRFGVFTVLVADIRACSAILLPGGCIATVVRSEYARSLGFLHAELLEYCSDERLHERIATLLQLSRGGYFFDTPKPGRGGA